MVGRHIRFMNRPVATSAIAVVVVLLLQHPASAKGVSQIAVCGPDVCRDLTQTATTSNVAFPMGRITDPPSGSAPFVRVVTTISMPAEETGADADEVRRSSYLYVPSLHLMRGQRMRGAGANRRMRATWQKVDALTQQDLHNHLAGIKRFPGRPLAAIGRSPAVTLPPDNGVPGTGPREPEMTIHYVPKKHADDGGTSISWWLGGGAGAAALAGLALVTSRRRRGAPPANAARAT